MYLKYAYLIKVTLFNYVRTKTLLKDFRANYSLRFYLRKITYMITVKNIFFIYFLCRQANVLKQFLKLLKTCLFG